MWKMFDWLLDSPAAREQAEQEAKEHEELERRKIAVISDRLDQGHQIKIIRGTSDVGLHSGEELLCVLPGTTFSEPRSVREYQSGSTGTSIRVMKGLSFRFGGTHGQAEYHDELRLIGQGDFIITTSRVIFCGSTRTVSMAFDQIIGTEWYDDGMRVSKEGRDRPYLFVFDTSLLTIINGCVFNVTGKLVNCLLDQAKVLARGRRKAEAVANVGSTPAD
jgi:hypothetical protein